MCEPETFIPKISRAYLLESPGFRLVLLKAFSGTSLVSFCRAGWSPSYKLQLYMVLHNQVREANADGA